MCHENQVRKKLKHNCAAIQFPIGLEDQIKGLVDLVHNQAYYFQGAHGYVLGEYITSLLLALFDICCVSHLLYGVLVGQSFAIGED